MRVKPGAAVSFEAYAEVPDNGGKITNVDFSFEGETDYPEKGRLELMNDGREAVVRTTHTYKEPGVYFGVVRFKSNLDGNAEDNFTQIVNLARVRVIVE